MPTKDDNNPSAVNIRRKIYELIAAHQALGQEPLTQDKLRFLFGGYAEDVDLHLEQLRREGLLDLGKRGVSLTPTYAPLTEIQFHGGTIRRGKEADGGSNGGCFGLDLRGAGIPMAPELFAVRVHDHRMIDAGIKAGDIAMLVPGHIWPHPFRGEVVAVERAGAMVLRRYLIVSDIPHFLAENSESPELLPAWDVPIHGVLWGLMRTGLCRDAPRKRRISYSDIGNSEASLNQAQATRSRKHPPTPHGTRKQRGEADWPKPPSGTQLNEVGGPFRSTEEPGSYGT